MGERDAVLEAVMLAAGRASRFGAPKLLAAFGDGTVLSAALAAAFAAPVRRVWVVVGCGRDAVAVEAGRAAVAAALPGRLRIIEAADWAEGMAASLRAGIGALPTDAEGAFVFLGDMPRIPRAIAPALAAALQAGASAACPVVGTHRGHPALIGRALFPELLALSGDQGARRVLDRLGPRLTLVETDDPGVLLDVDTPGDLAALSRL